MRAVLLALIAAGAALMGVGVAIDLPGALSVFTGGSAKLVCSAVFVTGREPAAVIADDLDRRTSPGKYLAWVRASVDEDARSVTATVLGLVPRTAIFRDGIGCTAAEGVEVAELRAQGAGVPTSLPPPDESRLWPEGAGTLIGRRVGGVDAGRLEAALDRAFQDPDPERPRRTRAVVVVHRGRIVAERYAPGYGRDTGHLSNSIAKSVTSALVGILVGRGRLEVHAPAPVAEWQGADDPRRAITLDQLLRMSSGLEFGEDYSSADSDTTRQYVGGDLSGFAASKPLEAAPGEIWHYSTGTSNLLGRIVREAAGATLEESFAFPRRALFDPLGMRTAVLEVDGRGNFVGGTQFYASARDYARLGLLYLRDGVWQGRRILPEGWVGYTRTPTPGAPPDRGYGAQFWLNTGVDPGVRRWPTLPAETFAMLGHQGQMVFVVPSHDLVVTRFGLSEFGNWDPAVLVADVISALASPRLVRP